MASDNSPPPVRLLVCVGPRCDAKGRGRAMLTALEARLPDAGDILRSRDCLRLCGEKPIARLEPSGEIFAGASVDDLMRAVAEAKSAALKNSSQ